MSLLRFFLLPFILMIITASSAVPVERENPQLWTRTGNISLYKGVLGDPGESLFHQENGLTGSGWLYLEDPSPAMSGLVYYRGYSTVTSGGNFSAYSNPVWARIIPATR